VHLASETDSQAQRNENPRVVHTRLFYRAACCGMGNVTY
jgi:hypothetical protein